MRWERLFGDLEAEFEAAETAELEADIAERTRSERARLRLVDRLRGSVGRSVVLRVLGAGQLSAEVRTVGVDWLLVRPADGADRLVRIAALLELGGLAPSSAAEGSEGFVAARFSLGAVLRGLARDRTVVTITLVDASTRMGVIDVVGADLVEISERMGDEPGFGRPIGQPDRRTIPITAIAIVREH